MKTIRLFSILLLFILPVMLNATIYTIQTHDSTGFDPDTVNATCGDTIRWEHVPSTGNHTIQSTTIPNGATPFDTLVFSDAFEYMYVVSEMGTYHYMCVEDSIFGVIVVSCSASVAATVDLAVQVWPVPFDEYVSISLPGTDGNWELSDLEGKIVSKGVFQVVDNEIQVNTATIVHGIYMLRIESSGLKPEFLKVMK